MRLSGQPASCEAPFSRFSLSSFLLSWFHVMTTRNMSISFTHGHEGHRPTQRLNFHHIECINELFAPLSWWVRTCVYACVPNPKESRHDRQSSDTFTFWYFRQPLHSFSFHNTCQLIRGAINSKQPSPQKEQFQPIITHLLNTNREHVLFHSSWLLVWCQDLPRNLKYLQFFYTTVGICIIQGNKFAHLFELYQECNLTYIW